MLPLFLLRFLLLLLLLSVAVSPPLQAVERQDYRAADLLRKLDLIMEDLMQRHAQPGLQICLFDWQQVRGDAYGHIDPEGQKSMEGETLLQAGSLVRPLTAYLLLRHFKTLQQKSAERLVKRPIQSYRLKRPIQSYRRLPFQGGASGKSISYAERLTFGHLLSMTSGLPASRAGIVPADQKTIPDMSDYLAGRLQLTAPPGSRIAIAPEGYAWLGLFLEEESGLSFSKLLKREGREIGLTTGCVKKEDCPSGSQFATALITRDKYLFYAPQMKLLYPAADSLYTSACSYARFLRKLQQRAKSDPSSAAAELFRLRFAYDRQLGGSGYGLFQTRPLWKRDSSDEGYSDKIYQVESVLPGYASFAFVTFAGKGAVLLSNRGSDAFIYEIRSLIWNLWNILNTEPQKVFAKAAEQEMAELEGFYRPVQALPIQVEFLSFINDLHLRAEDGRLELGGIFDKSPPIRLYRMKKDLYLARGRSRMDGWRLLVVRDQEQRLQGLASDLVRFERIPALFSIWGIIIAAAILVMLPLLAAIAYFIFRSQP